VAHHHVADKISVIDLAERRVLKADPAYRRRVFIGYGLFLALLVLSFLALIQWGRPALARYLDRQRPTDAVRLLGVSLKASMVVSAAFGVVVSAYVFRLGWRVRTSGQLPRPGTRVWHDTPIVEGAAALRQGMLMMTVGVVLAIVFISAAAYAVRWDPTRLLPARAR
jgi:hypothetical protein